MREGLYLLRIRESVKPLRSRLEAIQKLKPQQQLRVETPTTIKGCISFTGMVNILSLFCPE